MPLQTEQENITLGEPYASIQVAAGLPTAPSGLSKSKLGVIGVHRRPAGRVSGSPWPGTSSTPGSGTRPDIASVTESPILAELPEDNEVRSGKVAIAMLQAPQSLMAESIRELRTSLRVILDDTPFPVLVVTSPEPGDGKTFVTANLAAAWAMGGSKVIVVSADFRRPRLEEIFGLEVTGQPGLSNLIRANWKNSDPDLLPNVPRGEGARRRPARRTPGAGRRTAHTAAIPARVLAGPRAARPSPRCWWRAASGASRCCRPAPSWRTPASCSAARGCSRSSTRSSCWPTSSCWTRRPVLAVPDTAILGSMARGAVIVASEGKTDRTDLERTVRRLENTHCRVLGIAINRVKRASTDSYQSYAYKQ